MEIPWEIPHPLALLHRAAATAGDVWHLLRTGAKKWQLPGVVQTHASRLRMDGGYGIRMEFFMGFQWDLWWFNRF